MFSCEYCEIFKKTFFIEHLGWLLLVAASRSLYFNPHVTETLLLEMGPWGHTNRNAQLTKLDKMTFLRHKLNCLTV